MTFVLAVMLAMMLVITGGGWAALHDGGPWQVYAPSLQSYLQVSDTWPIPDPTVSVPLPRYAFAQVSGNTPLAVHAGGDQTVGEGNTVMLSGSAMDTEDNSITYTWSQTGPVTPRITFANASASSTTFTAPSVTDDTVFTFVLTAHDGTQPATDTLNVTVKETGAAFITTWAVSDSDRSITLPMMGTYSILWGDGSHSPDVGGSQFHSYDAAGIYTVTVLGDGLESIRLFGDTANARQLRSIEQWGDTKWTFVDSAFEGAANMVYHATAAPNLSDIASTAYMFTGASSFDGDLSDWNVSSVTYMAYMFKGASSFDGDISDWDVSSVIFMNEMFNGASSFNRPLNSWNVSSAVRMIDMFNSTSSFNQNLGAWYIVPASTDYDLGASSLDVTTISAQNWYLSGQNSTYGVGSGGDSDLFEMRGSTLAFKSTPDAGSYTVKVRASGNGIFESGNNWRTLKITVHAATNDPPEVHAGGDQTVGEGDTVTLSGSATDPEDNSITYTWSQTGSAAAPRITFANASAPSTTFTAPSVTGDTTFTFVLTAHDGTQPATDTLNVTVKETRTAFITTWTTSDTDRDITLPMNGTYSVLWGDGSHSPDVSGSQSHSYNATGTYTVTVLGDGLENIYLHGDPPNVRQLRSIEQWGSTEWTSMDHAFYGANNMVYHATDVPNLSGVTDMDSMFASANAFNGDLSDWNVSSVTNMVYMFSGTTVFNSDLSDWDVSSVTNMGSMFSTAIVFNSDLSDWDVSSVTNMGNMFSTAFDFDSDLSGWNVSSVTNMSHMFSTASSFNSDLSGWNVSSVLNMNGMFSNASDFRQNMGHWYVVLNNTSIRAGDTSNVVGTISAQNKMLDDQNPTYGLGAGGDSDLFVITGSTLNLNPTADYSNKTWYSVNITSTGDFGTGNHRVYGIAVSDTDITISDTAPTVTSIKRYDPAVENTNSPTLIYKVTFSEDVTGVTESDFVLSSSSTGRVSGTTQVTYISGSGDTYHVTVSPSTDGTYNLDLVSSGHNIVDTANNPLINTATTGADQTYTVSTAVTDNTNPRLASIERYDPASQNTDSPSLVYKATFSENVTGVTASDFVLSSGSTGSGNNGNSPVTSISGSGDTYHITVSPSTDGTYNLDLVSSGHNIEDAADNPLTNRSPTGADETYTVSTAVIDNTNPRLASIERHIPASQNTNSQSLTYEVTFSEDVTGVTASDFTLSPSSTGGGGTSTTASTGQFTQTRSPNLDIFDLQTASDAITVSDSGTATSISVAVDITHTYIEDLQINLIAPDGTSRTLRGHIGGGAHNINQTYTPSFESVPISGVWTLQIYDKTAPDPGFLNSWTLTINHGSGSSSGTASPVTSISGSGSVYYAEVFASTDGTYNLDLVSSDHNIEDAADNPLTNRSPTGADETYTVSTAVIDNTNPRLASIERYDPASQNTDSPSLVYKATFSENVTGVTASDFVLSSGSTGSGNNGNSPVTSISGSGDTYHITVSPSTDGTYNLDLVSSGHNIEDAADNPLTNRSPTGADETYTVSTAVTDNTNPRLASIERHIPASQNTDSQSLTYEATFSEDVTGVTASDFTLSPSSTGGGGTSTTASTGQFTQTRSPNLDIFDLQTASDAITVSDSGTATSISVAVDITHTYIEDLQINLIAPDGTSRTLRGHIGGGAHNINQTYTPSFESVPISGVWTLQIYDKTAPDPGFLNSWTLTINHGSGSSSGTASPVTSISGSGSVYYAEVFASTDGTYNLDLVSSDHNIEDAADNPLTNRSPTGADETYTVSTAVIDNTNPRLASIERYDPASQNTDSPSLVYKATFSENVTGVTASDFVLSSGSTGSGNNGNSPVTSISGSGDTYHITVSPSTDGTYNLDLVSSGHNIEDAADNPLTNRSPTGADQTYTVSTAVTDNTNPRLASIERHDPASQNTDSQSLTYEATFSENVTGVTASDFVLSSSSTGGGGTATTPSTGQFTHTRSLNLTIPNTQTVSDTMTVSNSGTATSVSVSVDIAHTWIGDLLVELIAPDGTTARTLHNRTGSNTVNIDQTYTPSFGSVPISGVWTLRINDKTAPDPGVLISWTLTINYGDTTTTTVSPVTDISGSGDTYHVTVSPSTDGTYNLDLVSSGHNIVDTANNPLINTATTGADQTYTVSTAVTDNTNPRLASIERYDPASQNTDSPSLVYKATFSENVTGVTASDFVLSSGSTGSGNNGNSPVTSISGSGDTYHITVSPSTDGTYNLDLVSSGHNIEDAADNPLTNRSPTGADQTYTVSTAVIDNTNPRLASIERHIPASQNTNSQSLTYEVTFSEDVTGVTASDFTLSPSSTGGGGTSTTASTGQFTQTRSPNLDIFDLQTASDAITVSDSGTATSISVAVDITHTYIEDLQINLIAPDGTSRTLRGHIGGGAHNINQTYTPSFESVPISGVWTLQIYDKTAPDPGFLNSWTLTINHGSGSSSGTASPVTSISGSGSVYYAEVFASTDGTYNLDLVSSDHNIEDAADNPLTNRSPTGADETYTVSTAVIDNTNPRLASIERYDPASQNTDSPSLVYKATFSENVTGVTASDFVLSSGSTGSGNNGNSPVTSISGSGDTYHITVSPSTDGTYNLDLVSSGHNIEDAADNPLTNRSPTGADQTYTVSTAVTDNTNPRLASIERHDPASQNTDSQSLTYEATFSENVTGVTASDFVLSSSSTGGGGTATTPSTGQFTHTRSLNLTIPNTQTVSDTMTVSNSGTATSVSVSVDIAHTWIGDLLVELIAPDGTTARTLHNRTGSNTVNIDQTYTPSFGSVPISGVWTLRINDKTAPDPGVLISWTLTINYGDTTTTTVSPVTDISGSGDTYHVTVSPSTDGTYNLDLVSSGHNIVDTANNPLINTATTGADQTYTVSTAVTDNTNPRLASIERYDPASQNTDSPSLVYKATFSENVTGVTASDFVLSSGSTGSGNNGNSPVTSISGSGDTYHITVSPSTDGTYNLDLVSSGHNIEDAADNPLTNRSPTGADETYTVSTAVIDNTNPRLASIERHIPASQNTNSQSLTYEVTFSEDVTGVTASDFTLSPSSTGGGGTSTTASTGQFTQTRSPNLDIFDLQTASDAITVSDSGTATSISVAVDITHTYIEDLQINLIAPDGTSRTLRGHIGGGAHNINQTYTPSFESVPISGVWTLQIYDKTAPDPGFLNSWTLTINHGSGSSSGTASPVTSISGSGSVYYAEVFASTDGTYNLDLVSSDHNIEDAADNPLTNRSPTGADETYTVSTAVIDNTNPRLASIERYDPASQNTDSPSLVYKATFSENVTGVTASDFVLSSGSTGSGNNGNSPVTSISGSGDTYHITVSPSTDGTYNLDLVSSGHNIEDAADNPLTNRSPTGADQTYTVSTAVTDNTNPRLASIERHDPASQNTDSQSLTYEATFSENVTGVTASDFVLSSSSTGGGGTATTPSTGQFTHTRSLNLTIPNTQTVSDTMTVSNSGTATSVSVSVDIAHTWIGDLLVELIAPDGTTARTLHNRTGSNTVNIDQTYTPSFGSVPISGVWTLRINDKTAPDPGVLISWTLTINYGDTTTTTVSPVTDISGSGDTYHVTVSPSTDGTYNLDLVSSGHNIVDTANNPLINTATTGADQTYTVSTAVTDNTNPRLASIERYDPASQNTDSPSLVYKATFSENVTGVTASDFVLSSGSTGSGNNGNSPVTSISGSGDTSEVENVPLSHTLQIILQFLVY